MAEPAPPSECANCGATIVRTARSCRECGADEKTGWRETDVYDGLDLPDEIWNEEESAPSRSREIAWYWWLAAMALFIALLLTVLGLR
jgi:hypothetical protein